MNEVSLNKQVLMDIQNFKFDGTSIHAKGGMKIKIKIKTDHSFKEFKIYGYNSSCRFYFNGSLIKQMC